jgi:hypothetical protein
VRGQWIIDRETGIEPEIARVSETHPLLESLAMGFAFAHPFTSWRVFHSDHV